MMLIPRLTCALKLQATYNLLSHYSISNMPQCNMSQCKTVFLTKMLINFTFGSEILFN